MACFSSKQQMLPLFKPSATAAPHGGAARGKSRWRNQRHWCYQLWQNGSVYMDSTNKTDGRDHKRGIRTTPGEKVSQEMTHRSKGREVKDTRKGVILRTCGRKAWSENLPKFCGPSERQNGKVSVNMLGNIMQKTQVPLNISGC